jgi:hypothetical protein
MENVTREQAWAAVKEDLRSRRPGERLTVEIKRWKPLKTQSELGLLFTGIEFYLKNNPEYGYVTPEMKDLIYQGLVEKYGFRKKTGFTVTDEFGNEHEQTVAIRLSKVNRYEQFDVIYNGLINEMWEHGVDATEYIMRVEQYRRERETAKT